MNPDAQAQLDAADMMLSDPDPEVRRAYLAAYGTDLPRKRAPMPRPDQTRGDRPNDFLMGEGSDEPDRDTGPWFHASYPGECSGYLCGMWFVEGDQIRADGEGGWEARECYESRPEDHE